jgi:uncharacterized protein YrrD
MKRSIKTVTGSAMGATNGEIGKVKEFYFEDVTWAIRYLVVETGTWLSGRKTLISPEALLTPDWKNKVLPVNLTKEQIKNSPDIDTDKPVSRQHELDLYSYYPWTTYWGDGLWGGMGPTGMMMPPYEPVEPSTADKENLHVNDNHNNPHLRSTSEITGYMVKAEDGEAGNVDDVIFDDNHWKIEFVVVDTGHLFPGKKVLVPCSAIQEINWESSSVVVKGSAHQIRHSAEFDPAHPTYEPLQ